MTSVTFTSAHLYGNVYMRVGVACALTDWSDFGLLGSKIHKNLWFPDLDADEPPSKMWRPLALSSVEKSVSVQTHTKTHKQTVNDIFTPCLWACVDNNTWLQIVMTNSQLYYVCLCGCWCMFQPMSTYQVNDTDIAYIMSANPATDFPDLNNASYELAYVLPVHISLVYRVCQNVVYFEFPSLCSVSNFWNRNIPKSMA